MAAALWEQSERVDEGSLNSMLDQLSLHPTESENRMSAVEAFGSLVTGNLVGAIDALFKESPEENIREAAKDILDGKDVGKNMQKLQGELARSGGNREKVAQVDGLMKEMASGRADLTSTMEQILSIVGPKDARKMGITPTNAGGKSSGCVEF